MIRARYRTTGIALIVCACAVGAAVPATAGAQSAVDEYTLDLPGGGSPSASSGGPPAGAAGGSASGSGGGERGESAGRGDGDGAGGGGSSVGGRDASGAQAGFAPFHEGEGAARAIGTSPRSAPEVVADTLLDGTMLPLLGALVVITGVGAWRVLRHRRTLTGTAG
jgi:hypothetical protein